LDHSKETVTSLSIASSSAERVTVERVSLYKLLGIRISDSLKWDDHIDVITSKTAKRLWFLKKLKRAAVSVDDLVQYYQTVGKTSAGVRVPSMALQFVKAADRIA